MYKVTEKTKGVPGDCLLQMFGDYGCDEECFVTGNSCKIDGGKCPFDSDDVIQLEFKREK